ncbi:hypothetical protein [Alienimonas californiensis]|uniref:Uncharacterized protein n=1 Tax=Alienimonas californiensis TaxID=2527989 RepID=A0A517P663_9PLAN|nr:hypothetical protein [Alienimonas californiensis]QDT14852.1 hypothetical protein CA12_09320 [Alienimonas californiensis]
MPKKFADFVSSDELREVHRELGHVYNSISEMIARLDNSQDPKDGEALPKVGVLDAAKAQIAGVMQQIDVLAKS